MMKRIIALFLALILTVGLLPTVALAAEGETPATDSTSVTEAKSEKNLNLVKTVTKEGDNYKVTLESWATGTVTTTTETKPLDIVLLLDVSGSMDETYSTDKIDKYVPYDYSWYGGLIFGGYNTTNSDLYDYQSTQYGVWHKLSDGTYVTVKVDVEKHKWKYIYTYSYTSNGKTTTIEKSEGANDPPKTQFYYKEAQNTTKLDALKTAVSAFIDNVATNSPNSNISIVKFADDRYKDTEGNDSYSNGYNYTQIVKKLTKVDTEGVTALKRAVSGLKAGGATASDYGLNKAAEALKDAKQERVVILFTDGEPNYHSGFDKEVATNAVNKAKELKTAATKTTIYTVGVFKNLSENVNLYMSSVSSNYPNASAAHKNGNWKVTDGGSDFGKYYMNATNPVDLLKAFQTISSEVSGGELGAEAVLTDVIAPNFALVAPEGTTGVTAYTVDKTADGWSTQKTTLTNGVTVGTDGQVNVTGFDYSENCVTTTAKPNTTDDYGKKLVVEFTIHHNNYGGTQPTNAGASIKDKAGKEVIKVDDPTVPVKITEPSITGVTRSKVYDGTGFDVLSTIAEDINALADGKKNAYVDIVVTVTSGSNTYTYTIKKGDKSGSWDKTGLTTDKDVKIENNGAVSSYTYDLNITFKDATDNGATKAFKNATATYTITKRPVTLTSGSDEKKYDGTPLTKHEVTAATDEGVGFVGGDGATCTFTGSQTEAGESDNTFDYILNDGTVATNYEITKQVGKLKVTKDDTTKITVTITGKTETKEYNGQTQTVTGFDYTVTGADKNDVTVTLKEGATASASGKDVKTDNDGKYMMGLIASNFTVSSDKYSSVTIKEVEDGWIKITPAQVTLTSETASKDYDGAPLTKPDVTVGGSGQDVFKSEVTGITATGTVTDPGPAVDNTITYTPDTNFKESNYNISKSEGKLSINDIAAPTNLPTVNVYCTNTEVEHADSTGNALKNNTYTSVVSKNAENKYICTITLTDKNSYISDYDASTGAKHTSDTTKTDFTKIILHYDTDAKAWPTPIVNFALNVKCDTPTVNVTYTWDGLDENDFDTVYPVPAKPDDATPNKGSDYTVNTRYNNSSIAIGKDGVRYKFSGWSSATSGIAIEDGEIKNIQTDVTLTGHWTKLGTGTFDLNDKIFKSFEKKQGSKDIPGSEYTFEATVTRLDKENNNQKTNEVYTGTVTLNGATDAAAFVFNNRITFHTGDEYRFLVEETPNTVTTLSSDEQIDYDDAVYYLYVTVSDDLKTINYRFDHVVVITSAEEEPAATENQPITFRNYYDAEKDPDKLYLDFSKYVQKELTATGSKTANDVKFRVIVNGMESPYMMYNVGEEEVSTYAAFDPKYSTVLNVNFASITGGNTETEWFIADNSIVIDQAGIYYFELNEEDGKRTGVTYDDSIYKVLVYVERKDDKLVVKSFDIMKDNVYVDGDTITFHNTIDTGKDDYYPIIIPTIINKDTGMLNKTDHFAYVIGYPDGTVHPNGQITRAEVATIFFRLLRDEVRDGAFTTSNSYSDVAYGKWYNNPISTMSALGIITGYPDGTFKPNKPITRAEFAAIAARFDETQSGKSATFSDVIGHWAAKEIGIAYYNDWIKGYPDGTFKPDQNITRAEAMTLINRVLERKPESPADLLTNMNKWTDNMDTSKWYYLDVQEATNSHGYTRKTFNYELWRQMLPDPDWSRYER